MSTPQSADQATGPIHIADRYRVAQRVGSGGTAVVYRCMDEHSGRTVAVKALRTNGPLIQEAAGRFRREAHLAASLAHRHIVRVLDYGYSQVPALSKSLAWADEGDHEVPFLAMEYIFGPNLKEVAKRYGQLPLNWVYQVGFQLCDALHAAHERNVVHRDVKPQNVMLVDSAIELIAILTDFGIARQVGGEYTALTVTGQVLGTPDYLAPEQVMGEPGDHLCDLYSLGIVLYELITGHLPFEADAPLAAASLRMVAKPPPLSTHRPDVPPALEQVILATLEKNPKARPQSALELSRALLWSQRQTPVVTEGPPGGWLVPIPPVPASGIVERQRTRPIEKANEQPGPGPA